MKTIEQLDETVERGDVCGIPMVSCGIEPVLREMDKNVRTARKPQWISITGTEAMYYALHQKEHLHYIRNASFSLCDGIGVVVAGMLKGWKILRVPGPVFMLKCCEFGVERGWRHFFYGGKQGVAGMLRDKLTTQFPGLITAGVYSPPFRALTEEEEAEIVERISATQPDIVWVGLGLPKQERWIARHIATVKAPWMIGVGAAFDFHAGTAKWAPPLIRRMALEWLYRLAHEPRMLKRDLRCLAFLIHAAARRGRA
jgi:N-acetylglucosaminyldiphosphoundecaprenol N-acetyl-beta-D-mannosaminyltransferase